jgi:hypothetical protein
VLLGGQVTTRAGQPTGGDFKNVAICTQPGQFGCVVAFSTFPKDPDATSLYGDSSSDLLSGAFGEAHGAGYQVACTDPGMLSGDAGPFPLTVPTKPFAAGLIASSVATNTGSVPKASTAWVAASQYAGACKIINGHHVYRYEPVGSSPATTEFPPGFGTHLLDFNLGSDRLVKIAATQTQAWLDDQLGPVATRANSARGTADLTLPVAGAGELALTAPGRLRAQHVTLTAPGRVALRVLPTARLAKRLKSGRHLSIKATITYTAAQSKPITRTATVHLAFKNGADRRGRPAGQGSPKTQPNVNRETAVQPRAMRGGDDHAQR